MEALKRLDTAQGPPYFFAWQGQIYRASILDDPWSRLDRLSAGQWVSSNLHLLPTVLKRDVRQLTPREAEELELPAA